MIQCSLCNPSCGIQWLHLLFSSPFVWVLPLLLSQYIFHSAVSCFFCSYFSHSFCFHFSKLLASCYFFNLCSPASEKENLWGEVELQIYCSTPDCCGVRKDICPGRLHLHFCSWASPEVAPSTREVGYALLSIHLKLTAHSESGAIFRTGKNFGDLIHGCPSRDLAVYVT